ncbi:MAG: hypothetical protein J0L56_13350 [Chitinophagales bacterium]|nr:hypothetical protein [Chitinophagales bacterium]
MKKLFIVLAVASLGFVACNNEGEKTESTVDSAAIKAAADSAAAAAAATVDTAAAKIDSAAAMVVDSLKK